MDILEIINIINGKVVNKGDLSKPVNDIKIDSRNLNKGDLFIAIKGKNFNGHNFIKQAIKKHVSAIIIDEEIVDIKTNIPIIKVKNTYDSLILIATHLRSQYNIPLIAVTGSVGKTTTKELIYNILSVKYNVLKNEKNNNNHIGLPLTLFKLNPDHEIIVTELGMNHSGELKRLSNICKPDVGVITNIGTSHIGNLGSKKAIFKAKMEILDGMKKGVLVVNGDDKYLKKIKENKKNRIFKCGSEKQNNIQAYNIKCSFKKTTFNIKVNNNEYEVLFPIPGQHLISNVLIAIQIGLLYDVAIEDIIEVIKNYKSIDKRMNIINLKNNNILIEDCYNSSYESLIGVLDIIKRMPQSKIIILGDILELGKYSKKIHLKIGRYLKKIKDKSILLVGNEMKVIKNKNKHFYNNEEVIKYLKNININNSIILLKGSRRMQLEEIKAYLEKKY